MDNGILNHLEFPGDLVPADVPFNVVGQRGRKQHFYIE